MALYPAIYPVPGAVPTVFVSQMLAPITRPVGEAVHAVGDGVKKVAVGGANPGSGGPSAEASL